MNAKRYKVSACYRYGLYCSQEYEYGSQNFLDHVAMLWAYGTSIHSVTAEITRAIRQETKVRLFCRIEITGPEQIKKREYQFCAYRVAVISKRKRLTGKYIVVETAVE